MNNLSSFIFLFLSVLCSLTSIIVGILDKDLVKFCIGVIVFSIIGFLLSNYDDLEFLK